MKRIQAVMLAGATVASLGAGQAGTTVSTVRVRVDVDSARVLEDLRYLSSSALAGRAAGSAGNAEARAYIQRAFQAAGAIPFNNRWTFEFPIDPERGAAGPMGSNVIAHVRGASRPDRYIIVTAHYDHLGARNGAIFHGADDNASGTAALLELARYFSANRPANSIIFAALDAEELGEKGATALVANPPVPLSAISLNINLDMISRNDRGELYVAGTSHYPFLNSMVDEVAARAVVRLRKGHDRPDGTTGEDWTSQSDHAAFHAKRIPFLYFGVEDHVDYHRPTDTFERIQPGFYVRAIRTVLDGIRTADQQLERIEMAAGRGGR